MTIPSSDPLEPQAAVRIHLRPLGTPLPLGFLGLCVATFSFAGLQLGWVPPEQGTMIALAVLGLTVPVQLIACVFGFLARDPVAGTGMGLLAGTWAAVGLVTVQSPPGADSAALGVVLIAAGAAVVVPALAGRAKTVAATVMALSAVRFAVTGLAELTGASGWQSAAGWIGVLLAVVSWYAALGFELEAQNTGGVPLWRRGSAATAMDGNAAAQFTELAREPGVRRQL